MLLMRTGTAYLLLYIYLYITLRLYIPIQQALRNFNPFMPTVPTFAVRETASLGQQMLARWA